VSFQKLAYKKLFHVKTNTQGKKTWSSFPFVGIISVHDVSNPVCLFSFVPGGKFNATFHLQKYPILTFEYLFTATLCSDMSPFLLFVG